MRQAGYPIRAATPATRRFLVVAGNSPSEKLAAGEVVQTQLEPSLGSSIRLRFGAVRRALHRLVRRCRRRKVLTCGSGLAWLKDFPDPQPMLQPVFDGDAIAPSNNTNYSQLNDPDDQRGDGEGRVPPRRRLGAVRGAQIDRMIVAQAACRPVAMGREHADPLQGRRRRAQRLLRQLGPLLHVAEVGAAANDLRSAPAEQGPSVRCG